MHRQITTIPRIKSQFAYGSGLEQAGCWPEVSSNSVYSQKQT